MINKTNLLTKIIKKKSLINNAGPINIYLVINMIINDPLIFLNVVENFFLLNFSLRKANNNDKHKLVFANICYLLTSLCNLIS